MSQARSEMVALNADVVGYSRLIADDLEATTATMDEYRDVVERTVGENGGTLVNFVGDTFMAGRTDGPRRRPICSDCRISSSTRWVVRSRST